jgi:hypothetical protein
MSKVHICERYNGVYCRCSFNAQHERLIYPLKITVILLFEACNE